MHRLVVRSPLMWDVFAISTYASVSAVFWFIGLIPDFATLRIRYIPDQRCVELKSLKLYLWSFREEGAFHEAVTNRILDDLVQAVQPRKMWVEGDFNVRGGIHTIIRTEYQAEQ